MKAISEMNNVEFDAAFGGRELLPIEQLAYENEGAERFAKFHEHGRVFPRQVEHDIEKWVAELNARARAIDACYESAHPNVAQDQSKADTEKWKRQAGAAG